MTIAEWGLCHTSYQYNQYYNVCYSIMLHPKIYDHDPPGYYHIPQIVLRGVDQLSASHNEYNNLTHANNYLRKFTIYSRIVLLVTSFSSMTSYLVFLIGMIRLYFWPHFKIIARSKHDNNGGDDSRIIPLHPFDDRDPNSKTSTKLTNQQALSFYGVLIVNILINFGMLLVFVFGQYLGITKNEAYKSFHHNTQTFNRSFTKSSHVKMGFEIVTVITYSYSIFCTLMSCFIFSKLAYGIQNKYKRFIRTNLQLVNIAPEKLQQSRNNRIVDYLQTHANNKNKDNQIIIDYFAAHNISDTVAIQLYYLQAKDKRCTEVAKTTIKQFEIWFFFHWILYIVSSFLSLSLFFETLIYYINSSEPIPEEGIDFHILEMVFLGLFSASNCLFFLYPCIRAASVTNSRDVQINELNNIYAGFEYIKPELKDRFAEFLRSQPAGFELHILCARVPFGFSVAYISIFIALFSVLVKVATSV